MIKTPIYYITNCTFSPFHNNHEVKRCLRNNYTIGCSPVRGDNPQALAWYNYFIPPTSVLTLHIKIIFSFYTPLPTIL